MSLSRNVKQYRLDFGPSQEAVAMALNMSQSTYSRVEKSDSCCVRYLDRIANALGTTPMSYVPIRLIARPNRPPKPSYWPPGR